MSSTAAQIFRELENGITKPFYAILGEEPFQTTEILEKIKAHFIKNADAAAFQYEAFDAEGLDAPQLLASLEMMPGLFSDGGHRLVRCDRFEKISAHSLEVLQKYFENPLESTSFIILGTKADKRKSWVKAVLEKGHLVEVAEPYDRDWPKWLGFFEKKSGKKIQEGAWEWIVESASRKLSLVWEEVAKLSLYVGERKTIGQKDVEALVATPGGADVFQLAEDVIARRKFPALSRFETLLRSGESEVKILSILVRQFRMVENCQRLMKEGVTDAKALGPKLGTHPFFVPKIQQLARANSGKQVAEALIRLSDCDYRMKTGGTGLFEGFLAKHLA